MTAIEAWQKLADQYRSSAPNVNAVCLDISTKRLVIEVVKNDGTEYPTEFEGLPVTTVIRKGRKRRATV